MIFEVMASVLIIMTKYIMCIRSTYCLWYIQNKPIREISNKKTLYTVISDNDCHHMHVIQLLNAAMFANCPSLSCYTEIKDDDIFSDGIKDKDKNLLGSILTQLAVLNTKDNQYSLTKHFYSEVKVDWPFYSQSDKQLLQK